jgi:hypothetical protein
VSSAENRDTSYDDVLRLVMTPPAEWIQLQTPSFVKVLRFFVERLRSPLQQRPDSLQRQHEESALLDCATSLTAEIDAELAQSGYNLNPAVSVKLFISTVFAQRLGELGRLRRQENGSMFPLHSTEPVSQVASTFVTEGAASRIVQQFPVVFQSASTPHLVPRLPSSDLYSEALQHCYHQIDSVGTRPSSSSGFQ